MVIKSSGGFAVITMRDKRQRCDFGRLRAAADGDGESGTGCGEGWRHEAQGYGAAKAGRKSAAGDPANHRAVRAQNLGAVAGRGALDQQADTAASESTGKFLEDARGAREVGGLTTPLRHGEVKPRFGRRDGLVEVVAVKRETGFKAQRVARTEADRLDAGIGKQGIPRLTGPVGRDQEFKAILAGIAGTRHH